MNITLSNEDIEDAIKQYLLGNGFKLEGKKVTLKFKAGRKGNGIETFVSIDNAGSVLPIIEEYIVDEEEESEDIIESSSKDNTESTDTKAVKGKSLFE